MKLPLRRILIFGSSQSRRYLRHHEDKMAIRLTHGATRPCVFNGTLHFEDDTVKACLRLAIRCDDDSAYCVVCRSVVNISSRNAEILWAFKVVYQFMQGQLRVQIMNLQSFMGNSPFYMIGKILIIQEREKFRTFACLHA